MTGNPDPEPFSWRRDSKGQTLAVNASVMNGDYKPFNAPLKTTANPNPNKQTKKKKKKDQPDF